MAPARINEPVIVAATMRYQPKIDRRVLLEVADHPLDGDHRGDEGEQQSDQGVDHTELVDEVTAVGEQR